MEVREASARYVRATGYRQTEVGVIPEDWSVCRLGQIGQSLIGLTYSPMDVREYGSLVLRASNVQNGSIAFDDNVYVDMALPDRVLVQPNDILICVRNGSRDLIGKCALLDDRTKGMAFGAFMAVFRSSANRIVFHHFQSGVVKKQITQHLGATINQITNASLNSFLIPLPPTKAEQEAIAEALSDADALIESLEHLLTKKRHLKQGAMQQLLTGKERLPGFSEEWGVKRLGDMLTICHGKSQRGVESADGPYPILATGGRIGWATRFMYDKPSVLIGRKGTIDQPQYMETPFWTVDTLFYTVIHESNHAKFLYYRFCLIDWKQHNEASGVPSLNARTIENIQISSPGPEEQTAIASILSDIDTEIGTLETKLAKARNLKQGMMQELLTGRIRLV